MYHRSLVKDLDQQQMVYVIPAFEMDDFSRGIPETKEELMEFVAEGRVRQVHQTKWKAAHGATNYEMWYRTEELYVVQYEQGYEPYIIGSKNMPLYEDQYIH